MYPSYAQLICTASKEDEKHNTTNSENQTLTAQPSTHFMNN